VHPPVTLPQTRFRYAGSSWNYLEVVRWSLFLKIKGDCKGEAHHTNGVSCGRTESEKGSTPVRVCRSGDGRELMSEGKCYVILEGTKASCDHGIGGEQ